MLGVLDIHGLDIHGLDVRKQPVLGTLLVVTLARDADTESVRNTFDALPPDLLVELGVETHVLSALVCQRPSASLLNPFHPAIPAPSKHHQDRPLPQSL